MRQSRGRAKRGFASPSTLRQRIRASREHVGGTWTPRGQVACVTAAAGTVGTRRSRSSSARGRNDAQARAGRKRMMGRVARWPRARLKWLGPVQVRLGYTVHQRPARFRYPNKISIIQMIQTCKVWNWYFQNSKNFQTWHGHRILQKEQLSFWDGAQIPIRIWITNSGSTSNLNLV
jgi:hypothetical protein